jgi:hypothetical protein
MTETTMTFLQKCLSTTTFLPLLALLACGGGGGGSTPPPSASAPSISAQPASQTVQAGTTATFTVTATGTAPLSYQWNKGATAIAGATNPSYTTPATVAADSGSSFTVTVSNATGAITSSAAVLTVQSAPASGLAYTDPTSGTYKLVKNAGSTGSHLVFDLVGPSTGTASGVSITLSADTTKVTWVDVPAGGTTAALLQNGTQFNLGAGTPIQKAKATGNLLQATVAQKNPTAPASLNGPLLQVALDLKAGLGLAQGTAITLVADPLKCQVLDGSGTIATITVAVGTLSAQ